MTRLEDRAELEVIEGGDHSFNVPKSSALTVQQVYEKISDRSIQWIKNRTLT